MWSSYWHMCHIIEQWSHCLCFSYYPHCSCSCSILLFFFNLFHVFSPRCLKHMCLDCATKIGKVWLCSLLIKKRSVLRLCCAHMSLHTCLVHVTPLLTQVAFASGCVKICVFVTMTACNHSYPLTTEEDLEAQGTHQPLTHSYLKELGESSCPQIMVKAHDSKNRSMYRSRCIYKKHYS